MRELTWIPVKRRSFPSLLTMNEMVVVEASRTLFFAKTRMSRSVGFVIIAEMTMSSIELTTACKDFTETFKSPLERPRARVVRPRRKIEWSIVDR